MRKNFELVFFVSGFVLMLEGIWMFSHAAALVVGGTCMMSFAVFARRASLVAAGNSTPDEKSRVRGVTAMRKVSPE